MWHFFSAKKIQIQDASQGLFIHTKGVFGGKEGRKRDERDFTDWLGGETNLFFIPL